MEGTQCCVELQLGCLQQGLLEARCEETKGKVCACMKVHPVAQFDNQQEGICDTSCLNRNQEAYSVIPALPS